MAQAVEAEGVVSPLVEQVAKRCKLPLGSVQGAVQLLREGNTIPFIARYRKERTNGLDEIALRAIDDTLAAIRKLEDRRKTVLKTIEEQGKLTDALRQRILECRELKELEEIYLPFKPKRKTRGSTAKERGLEPLAALMLRLTNPAITREQAAGAFVNPEAGVPDVAAAIQGASDILAEAWADQLETRAWLRSELEHGTLVSKARDGHKDKAGKFQMYYDHQEPLAKIPSHRFLAMRRGEHEGVLRVRIAVDDDAIQRKLVGRLVKNPQLIFHADLIQAVVDCYTRLLFPTVETAILSDRKDKSDDEAISVFSQNLRELLLAPPAGPRVVLAIDPGFRTGCKLAVVDTTGKFLARATIYPTEPHNKTEEATQTLVSLIDQHGVELIAIGNGTASRETHAFVSQALAANPRTAAKVSVNEAGASVYSASPLAASEFPELDVTIRGAISIARRLQDPLAELVKIDPKSIGVGQYQHDVHQPKLRRALDREVESCVDAVGVDVNTASAQLLRYVSGIGPKLAEAIVEHRNTNGPFKCREELQAVPRVAGKAFLQSAGFLRIRGQQQPLDDSAVHPESYYVVERMAQAANVPTSSLIGNMAALSTLSLDQFVDDKVGLPTLQDIVHELEKPGRDPRREFRLPSFDEAVHDIADLKEGMMLEGVVTNVTRFGVFVDIGVHHDGLIHVSELDKTYVPDPSAVVAVGDIVKVKVLQVDTERGRIALSRKQAM